VREPAKFDKERKKDLRKGKEKEGGTGDACVAVIPCRSSPYNKFSFAPLMSLADGEEGEKRKVCQKRGEGGEGKKKALCLS